MENFENKAEKIRKNLKAIKLIIIELWGISAWIAIPIFAIIAGIYQWEYLWNNPEILFTGSFGSVIAAAIRSFINKALNKEPDPPNSTS